MPRKTERVPRAALRDHVDQLIEGWAAERPDLDTTAVAIVYRLTRIAAVWNAEIDRVFASHGITSTDFAVLANLRRAGRPFQLNQRHLMTALRLTSGTVSLRIDKMVERGLVTRTADPSDARATIVTLTDAGAALFDVVAPDHLANESRLIASVPEPQRDALAGVLRTILIDVEQPQQGRPDHALGLVVAPAPATQRKRAELGLPPQHGLLVESVVVDGPAARAGVRVGDTITSLGDVQLSSLSCLERALERALEPALERALEPAGPWRATVLRGGRTVSLDIQRPA